MITDDQWTRFKQSVPGTHHGIELQEHETGTAIVYRVFYNKEHHIVGRIVMTDNVEKVHRILLEQIKKKIK